MDYQEQLLTEEWKQKREAILIRDKFHCMNCSNDSFQNNLRSGILLTNFIRNDISFNSYHFINTSSPLNDFPDYPIFFFNDFLVKFFNKIPKFIWIDYLDNDVLFKPDIVFLRTIPEGSVQFMFKLLKEERNKEKMIDDFPLNFLKVPVYQPPELPRIPNEFDEGSKADATMNPYFNPKILSIGMELAICFAPKLNVHHKVYRENKLAWQYPDHDLMTLCWSCHEKIHSHTQIKCFSESGDYKGELTPCNRCFGAGWFPEYKHVQNGVCFRCRGRRYDEFLKDN